jgi:hypothetical protein
VHVCSALSINRLRRTNCFDVTYFPLYITMTSIILHELTLIPSALRTAYQVHKHALSLVVWLSDVSDQIKKVPRELYKYLQIDTPHFQQHKLCYNGIK